MTNVQIRWIVVGLLALGLSACDVQVGKCKRDDAGDCVSLFPEDEDAGDDEDAGELDAGLNDGGRSDGGADGSAGDSFPELEDFLELTFLFPRRRGRQVHRRAHLEQHHL